MHADFDIELEMLEEQQFLPVTKDGDLDLNDELQNMQDISCFNLFKKKTKKGRKYKEWKVDSIRDDDRNQMQFLEK